MYSTLLVRHCSRTRESALEQNCLRWLTPAELRLLDPTKIRFHAAHAHGKAEPRPVWVPPRPPVELGVRSLLVGGGLSNGCPLYSSPSPRDRKNLVCRLWL